MAARINLYGVAVHEVRIANVAEADAATDAAQYEVTSSGDPCTSSGGTPRQTRPINSTHDILVSFLTACFAVQRVSLLEPLVCGIFCC